MKRIKSSDIVHEEESSQKKRLVSNSSAEVQEVPTITQNTESASSSSNIDTPTKLADDPKIENFIVESVKYELALRSIESEYVQASPQDRTKLINICKILQSKLAKLVDVFSSAEILILRDNSKGVTQHYGKFNLIETPDVWAVVFSFLTFSDFLKVSRVCKVWRNASQYDSALSSFELTPYMDFSNMSQFEIFKTYIEPRKKYIRTASGLSNDMLHWLSSHGIIFKNATYIENEEKVEKKKRRGTWQYLEDMKMLQRQTFLKIDEPYTVSGGSVYHVVDGVVIKEKTTKEVVKSHRSVRLSTTKPVEFEDAHCIQDLALLKCPPTLPEFPNLTRLHLEGSFDLEASLKDYKFRSIKLDTLRLDNDSQIRNLSTYVNLAQIKTLQIGYPKLRLKAEIFSNITSLEVKSIYESSLKNIGQNLKSLSIEKLLDPKGKITSYISNIERLNILEDIFDNLSSIKSLVKLRHLTLHASRQNSLRLESGTLQSLEIHGFELIYINCVNLSSLIINEKKNNCVSSLSIFSQNLNYIDFKGAIGVLSITGPNHFSNGHILSKVGIFKELQCPLMEKIIVNSIESMQSESCKRLISLQVKSLTLRASFIQLFEITNNIEYLTLENWETITENVSQKLFTYKENSKHIKKLVLKEVSEECIEALNTIFQDSPVLETLEIDSCRVPKSLFSALERSSKYPNLQTLKISKISTPLSLNLMEVGNRSNLKHLRFDTSVTGYFFIPHSIEILEIYNFSALSTTRHENLKRLTMIGFEKNSLKNFPNLTHLTVDSGDVLDVNVLKHCKHLKMVMILDEMEAALFPKLAQAYPQVTFYVNFKAVITPSHFER
ncbi:hypothetical protein C9374_007098 [Naegleria lovaniensis]|uniref:F-box domain-containing protein n=1 Tax=Naegleria lovaniensis TaxID=51637 RepID=A0AA88H6Q9_NAELO|nr:uncharacterized protein C9374_007098 [Naegleria lovaniensis]KAG2393567.1 hypothetical protein C9374_007098 [Naegleria lovaniensis]